MIASKKTKPTCTKRDPPLVGHASLQDSWNRDTVEIALDGLAGESIDIGGWPGGDVSCVDHASTGETRDLRFRSETAGRDVWEHPTGRQRQDISPP
jgi:hypothetical protein